MTDGLLYRRGNINGSWDQLIRDALMHVQGAEIAFSPGFRWGTVKMGRRITDMRLGGKAIEADKIHKLAGWATVAESARTAPGNKPVCDVVEDWLKNQGGRVAKRKINTPKLLGVGDTRVTLRDGGRRPSDRRRRVACRVQRR